MQMFLTMQCKMIAGTHVEPAHRDTDIEEDQSEETHDESKQSDLTADAERLCQIHSTALKCVHTIICDTFNI